jgi:AcrR family transcriptional regulator
MARAGLTHGGFYAHFGSKEELIAAAIERMFEIVDRAFLRRIEGLEPAEALAYFIDDYLSARHFDSVSDGCPLPAPLCFRHSLLTWPDSASRSRLRFHTDLCSYRNIWLTCSVSLDIRMLRRRS